MRVCSGVHWGLYKDRLGIDFGSMWSLCEKSGLGVQVFGSFGPIWSLLCPASLGRPAVVRRCRVLAVHVVPVVLVARVVLVLCVGSMWGLFWGLFGVYVGSIWRLFGGLVWGSMWGSVWGSIWGLFGVCLGVDFGGSFGWPK